MPWFLIPPGRTIVDASGNCKPMSASAQQWGSACKAAGCTWAARAMSEEAALDALDSHRQLAHNPKGRPFVRGE